MVRLFIPIALIALAALSDLYIYHRYVASESVWRWLWWLPMATVVGFCVKFLFFNRGLMAEYNTMNIFLLLLVLVCIPKMVFALLALIPKVGTYVGLAAAIGIVGMVLWGITAGFSQLRVREITFESENVPVAFDGYRIVQFSDAHTGTFRGRYRHLLGEGIDSINALQPDLVCFVGDIENFSPEELAEHREAFSRLKARDGVFSVMGNHDYSTYINVTDRERAALVEQTRAAQRSFGWQMLRNEHRIVTRQGSHGTDSIAIVGEENWGKPPFPQYGDIRRATAGLNSETFTIVMSHDPNAWEDHILPVTQPDITLSGHTHGTQFSLFGWSPASMMYRYWGGEYYKEHPVDYKEHPADCKQDRGCEPQAGSKRMLLNVSTGFGGNFPFRFGMPREIVLITLKHKK